jgi:hypothetical protein
VQALGSHWGGSVGSVLVLRSHLVADALQWGVAEQAVGVVAVRVGVKAEGGICYAGEQIGGGGKHRRSDNGMACCLAA